MKLNRNSKIFINYFLGPLLFIWLSWSIYRQVQKQPNLETALQTIRDSFNSPLALNLLAVILLMIVNWSIEAVKWKMLVKPIQKVSFIKALRAILSGVSFSVSMPNRIGEYLGRVMYMDEGNRLKTISITIVGSISQLMITVLMGFLGILVLREGLEARQVLSPVWMKVIIYGVLLALVVITIIYFRLSWIIKWIDRIPAIQRFTYLIKALEDFHFSLLIKLLLLSALRFSVFILQYYLLFPLFGVEITWLQCLWTVSVSFLVMAAIPTIAILELPLRGNVMTTILALYTANSLGVGFTAAAIWLINLIVPAVVGSVLILGLRKLVKDGDSKLAEKFPAENADRV
jgi:uncharacterized membrane protein YbhN (UPF0104 family)